MRVLLDTCVLAALYRKKEGCPVYHAIEPFSADDIFISAISFGRFIKGVAMLKEGSRKRHLQAWVQSIETMYRDRILPINTEIVRIWGEIAANAEQNGSVLPTTTGLVAATALAHGLHLMTKNINDFKPTGVLMLNPWEEMV